MFVIDFGFLILSFMVQIAAMQALDAKNFNLNWVSGFKIGSVVEGEIQEKKEFGVVLSFKDHGDVVGFIAQHQCNCTLMEYIFL